MQIIGVEGVVQVQPIMCNLRGKFGKTVGHMVQVLRAWRTRGGVPEVVCGGWEEVVSPWLRTYLFFHRIVMNE